MDYIKVGIFSCNENKNLLTKTNLKNLIDTQRLFPSNVVLNYYNNFYKSSNYSFECYRIDKHFMEKIDLIQVEEDDPNIFKKFTKFNDIMQKLDFEIINDVHSILGNMINKTVVDNMKEIVEENKDQRKKLFSKIIIIDYQYIYFYIYIFIIFQLTAIFLFFSIEK